MYKVLAVLALFLVACSSPGEAFTTGSDCHSFCWLGIDPGFTSTEEAALILAKSRRIDQKILRFQDKTELRRIWYTTNDRTFYSKVTLYSTNNMIDTVRINLLYPFPVGYFVALLGEPDLIRLDVEEMPDGDDLLNYELYFETPKVTLAVYHEKGDGPDPTDPVWLLTINTNFEPTNLFLQTEGKPWLGFGHLREYLAAQSDAVDD
jgi:hypothetical protein